MKFLKTLFFIFLINFFYSQSCHGIQSFTLTPPPPLTGYSPGTVVNVCYTMDGWNFNAATSPEWLEGFSITLGPGWSNLTPGVPPADCFVTTSGHWIWQLTTTSTNSGLTLASFSVNFNVDRGAKVSPSGKSQSAGGWPFI